MLKNITWSLQSLPGIGPVASKRILNDFLRHPEKSAATLTALLKFLSDYKACIRCGTSLPIESESPCMNCVHIAEGAPIGIITDPYDYILIKNWKIFESFGWIVLPGYTNPTAKRSALPAELQYCLKILNQNRPREVYLFFNNSLESRGLIWILQKHHSQLHDCSKILGNKEHIFCLTELELEEYHQKIDKFIEMTLLKKCDSPSHTD
ncbi:MAG: hypothetical protein FJ161_04850 [Gammaproteobacteria bacterium]|nr:hypothetical protein [Gammaproteobacteria bacterium]